MPFISSFDPRRNLLQNGVGASAAGNSSSYSVSSSPISRTFDRFSSTRKSGVFERPSTYSPTPTLSDNLTSKYRSSTLERYKNGSADSAKSSLGTSHPPPPTSPTSYLSASSRLSVSSPIFHRSEASATPFGTPATSRFETSVPSYHRTDSHNSNSSKDTNGVGDDHVSNGFKSYRPSNNNNSSVLFPESTSTSSITPSTTTTTTGKPGYQNGGSNAASELTKRISSTLARHGIDETASKRNSYADSYNTNMGTGGKDNSSSYKVSNNYSNGDYASNSMSWRRKLEPEPEPEPLAVTEKKTVISRATSPQPDSSKQVRTRIARTTDQIYVEKRRSRQPRSYEVACQTDPNPEFELLSEYLRKLREEKATAAKLKLLNSPSFDYFARVKKAMEATEYDGSRVSHQSQFNDVEEEDYYKVKKAPMMALLPGARSASENREAAIKKSSFQSVESAKSEEEESEYTYDEDEEEEDEENVAAIKDDGSYEAQAEKALENPSVSKDVSPELDYIGGEEDDVGLPMVTSPKRKRKGAFISGTVDIDILLGKETAPTNLVTFGASPPNASDQITPFFEFDLPKASQEVLEDLPWWLKINGEGGINIDLSGVKGRPQPPEGTEQTPVLNGNHDKPVDDPDSQEYAEEEAEAEGEAEDGDEWEEEEEEEEEAEEKGEEGDWEWEYYETEGEDNSKDQVEEQDGKSIKSEDVKQPWMVQGLMNIVPKIPKRSMMNSMEEGDTDAIYGTVLKMGESHLDLTEREKDYREWLAESEQLHRGAHFNLQAEIDTEDEGEENSGVRTPVPGAPRDVKKEGSPVKLSKAAKLVEKIKSSEGPDLKRVLFSLKTFFQTDKDLVYEFVKEGGLALLVELGQDDESQLQNLVLRSLGQLMLYVDGMNGVMENTKAIQFLYHLISPSNRNALVCKTAIKLLLVFVEYTENNCILFVQAVNAVDKELDVTPWTNLMGVLVRGTSKNGTSTIDKELAMYALTLINKSLYGIPSQDMFFDQTDYMEQLCMEDVIEAVNGSEVSEDIDEGLMQQVQLYNVARKQEDGEPVTEDDISYLDEDATEMGLRTTLRSTSTSRSEGIGRKSLRFKTKQIADTEPDESGDIPGITIRDVEIILAKNGLPTSRSTEELNNMELEGFLEKARALYVSKIAKGEVYIEPGTEECPEAEATPADQVEEEDPEDFIKAGEEKWNEIVANIDRPLVICDFDFTDLQDDDEELRKTVNPIAQPRGVDAQGIPLPPPIPPPAPAPPPPPPSLPPAPPPLAPHMMNGGTSTNPATKWNNLPMKAKKTAKLFWKEVREQNIPTIWDDMEPAEVDSAMIEYLFESRGKDCISKETKTVIGTAKEIIVLDHKRSNSINIGMTKLPPPRIIKAAVMKMDSATMNREGVEKLLTMLPTEEETVRIQEAQEVQPDIPLGTAEQFLLTLSSISGLEARLRLWSFKMEMEVVEKEVCDPLMDLKSGLAALRKNATFKTILNVLLTIGNFLNGSQCKGFQLDYLEKVPEVKDTVHKHSLLYHMTYWVLETFPNSSDLYSEIGPLTRASRTDFDELSRTLKRMENECKSAWNYLRILTRQELNNPSSSPSDFEAKMSDFLSDAAERILVMMSVHKKIMKRYIEFLQWMGIASHFYNDYKVHHVCKILSEFALEYRTTRERVIETIQKKKAAREKKRLAKKAALLAEAAALEALEQIPATPLRRTPHQRREPATDDVQLRMLLASNNIDITENGTLRRKKKHHSRSSKEHHHRHAREDAVVSPEATEDCVEEKRSSLPEFPFGEKKERKVRRHRSSMLEGTLPLTEETFKDLTTNEMERGLLETLMATSDSSTLKRSKDRRRSVKDKRSSKTGGSGVHDLIRSRTRENFVPEEDLL